MWARSNTRSTPKRRRCATRSSIDTTSICATSRKCGDAAASSRHGCWTSPQPRWRKIPHLRTLRAKSPTPGKGAGRSRPRSTRPYQCRCFRPRSMNVSARAAKRLLGTSCSPPCATNSAGTWRNPQDERSHETTKARSAQAWSMSFHLQCRWRTRTGGRRVKIEVHPDDDLVARKAAAIIAADARAAVPLRFIMAVSGGHTPWLMLRALADEQLPWEHVHVLQVDERAAPAGDPDRNLTHLRESLLEHAPLRPDHIHAMPVEAVDLERAAEQYALTLRDVAGSPPVLDLVHLGLEPDGHT